MSILKLKIDVSGTIGDQAWREIRHFDQIQSADFGPQFGSGGRCNHPPDKPHAKGEWIGAEIRLQTPLLAQYAMSHYLEQERVLDADVVDQDGIAVRDRGPDLGTRCLAPQPCLEGDEREHGAEQQRHDAFPCGTSERNDR